jgi:Sec-independent protein translocase protein TatA
MEQCFFHLAYIGPGGPEFLLVMLVLLMLFGAKDAPRILRKLNEIISQIRNTADGFKREVMYGDLNNDTPSYDSPGDGESDHDDDYDYGGEDDYDFGEDDGGEAFREMEESLTGELSGTAESEPESAPEAVSDSEIPEDEDGDARKT